MEYVNKGEVVALRGIHRTGGLDDDGLPELAWYDAEVASLTARAIIVALLDAIDYRDLDRTEQAAIAGLILDHFEKAFQRTAVRRIIRGYR